ncbi:universal stress protein [Modestobacter sp. VKM Ac-2986]|uniref:universal stress protein n=1 Tax=Modestobacter sp. VKM Ac-2986 TaxID=3004140 RepID=UPI0022AB545C|nr:universal stress protein [Modestobacter sp. VKM Ac-2986]MCZ2830998.1 universal stress protein [Modestobacter sp. VKM Ac-2986]
MILAGVDGSSTSLHAVAYAAGLARRQRSRLVVVFVAEAGPAMAGLVPGAGAVVREANTEIGTRLRAELLPVAEELGVEVDFRIASGDPVAEISRIADEVLADAVLVGASEQAGHRVVGSVAVRLVRVGRWPVTVVP